MIEKYGSKYKNSSRHDIPEKEKKYFDNYTRAIVAFNKELERRKNNIAKYNRIQRKYTKASEVLKRYFSDKNYNKTQLDSLDTIITDKEEKKYISYMKYYLKYDINDYTINLGKSNEHQIISKNLNVKHNGRCQTKDDANDLTDVPYGNNKVDGRGNFFHGTEMASIITTKKDSSNNNVKGILNTVKIMCLNTSTAGDEYDKDIALAIRYAVNNGAKVINMSFGKSFSLHPEWVKEAILYAESKNVLVVTSAGNNSLNLDQDYDYPNDKLDESDYKYANNFLKIGATTHKLNENLISRFSNYGKNEVDIFAPGSRINCLTWDESTTNSGTSCSSAVVSGIAALIFSYYPNLTAAEVKTIIMESGLSVDFMVNKPSYAKEKEKLHFNTLSKSGKIVNVYNALIMADSIANQRR